MARSERTLILLSHVDDDDGSTAGILFSIPNVWVEDGIYPLPNTITHVRTRNGYTVCTHFRTQNGYTRHFRDRNGWVGVYSMGLLILAIRAKLPCFKGDQI